MLHYSNLFGFSVTRQMFRRMGYFTDQSGILNRYRREQKYWDTHLQNTRNFAMEAMQGKERKSAAVLGSGWLLDVPLEEMSRYFEKVCLYDIRHPATVKRKAKQMGNVELTVCDISCFAFPVYRYAKQYRKSKVRPPISDIQPENGLDLSGFDFVFSCNILNQLDILLIDYMYQFFDLSREETDTFRSNVQQYHINLLPRSHSCIVADYREVTLTPDGKEISSKTTVNHPITQRTDARRWTWEFDTKMTYYRDRMTFLETLGIEI